MSRGSPPLLPPSRLTEKTPQMRLRRLRSIVSSSLVARPAPVQRTAKHPFGKLGRERLPHLLQLALGGLELALDPRSRGFERCASVGLGRLEHLGCFRLDPSPLGLAM